MFVLTGCGGHEARPHGTPRAAVESFLRALGRKDLTRACARLTPAGRDSLEGAARIPLVVGVQPPRLRRLVKRTETCRGAAELIAPRVRRAIPRLLRDVTRARSLVGQRRAVLGVPGGMWILDAAGGRWVLHGIGPLTDVSDRPTPP